MKYRVEIDLLICSGTSNCVEEAPDAYDVDDRGLAVLIPNCGDAEQYLIGARSCPVDAIRVFDATTGTRIHP